MKKKANEIELGDTIVFKMSKKLLPTNTEGIYFQSLNTALLRSFDKEAKKELGMVFSFEVDDITKEFINDEVSRLYGEMDEPLPEHTKYTFHHPDLGMFEIVDNSGSTYIWDVE